MFIFYKEFLRVIHGFVMNSILMLENPFPNKGRSREPVTFLMGYFPHVIRAGSCLLGCVVCPKASPRWPEKRMKDSVGRLCGVDRKQ